MTGTQVFLQMTMDIVDQLQARSGQLRALLLSVTGTGFGAFAELDPEHQERLLWLAADLATEIDEALARQQG